MHRKLQDVLCQGLYTEFFALAEESGIPPAVLEIIAEAKAPEFVDRYKESPVADLTKPEIKSLLDALCIPYLTIAQRMWDEALRLHSHQPERLQLLVHALDYFAQAESYGDMKSVAEQILADWPSDLFSALLHSLEGEQEVSWMWLFRVCLYMYYLTEGTFGIQLHHSTVPKVSSNWLKTFPSKVDELSMKPLPEIHLQEPFGKALAALCQDHDVRVVVEIGASTGQGSTQVFLHSLSAEGQLFSIEPDPYRYSQLSQIKDPKFHPIAAAAQPNIVPAAQVEAFLLQNPNSPLAYYGKNRVMEWWARDAELLSQVPANGIQQVPVPDLLLVDGSEFSGWQDTQAMLQRGRPKYIALDDTQTLKNQESFARLQKLGYRVLTADPTVRNGYAILVDCRPLPIHFFTLVLDGEPYIEQHYARFCELDKHGISWRWVVVEGVAALRHDTAWSLPNGGRIPQKYVDGHSLDGTVEYLRDLAAQDSRVVLIQKPEPGQYWDGKIEMVRAAQPNSTCLLWQIDSDELWDPAHILKVHELFMKDPNLCAAQFYCRYYVGPDLVLENIGLWGNNPNQEWWRVWRWDPLCEWVSHEPPVVRFPVGSPVKVLTCEETVQHGLIFDHFAYATRAQVEFKEQYYGYQGAVDAWERLQHVPKPCGLQDFFPWAYGNPKVQRISISLATSAATLAVKPTLPSKTLEVRQTLHLFVDGIFFRMAQTGIARVWENLLRELPRQGIRVSFYDRGGSPPLPANVQRIPGSLVDDMEQDTEQLTQAFVHTGADIFMSTYYTHLPKQYRQVLIVHDMIPEVFQWDLSHPMWVQKHAAIQAADAFIAVSQNTARDFQTICGKPSVVAYPGVDTSVFHPDPTAIPRHWLLIGCSQGSYKGHERFFAAYQTWPIKPFPVLCTLGAPVPPQYQEAVYPNRVVSQRLSTQGLVRAYQTAVALVYPSQYEGFGLPILEAQACGTPVVAYPNSAIPEAGGDAVFYVEPDSEAGLAIALARTLDPIQRTEKVKRGLERVQSFTWERMAKTIVEVLCTTKKK